MFCAHRQVFGVRSHFHVLCARTHLRLYRGRLVLFSCFALPNSFSTVSRASGPVYPFCVPELVIGGMEGVVSCFHVLRSWTRFRHFRGRRVPFSCFASPYSFPAVPRASCPVFMFCAPVLIFGETEGVVSGFHVLCSRTYFRRNRGRQVPFSCFARPN
jgi:hypothetical protein